uniref:Gustatory receptor n=1 Tax=Strigamia maritima TaxID=126957 RepID=T1IRA4_STRMM
MSLQTDRNLTKAIIMQLVHSLESNVDNTTLKINRFWRYFYKCYGLQFSNENANATKAQKCYFTIFLASFVLTNALATTQCLLDVITNGAIENICILISTLAYWTQSFTCLVVLYKRQNQFSKCINQLLKNITVAHKKRVWKFLLLIMAASTAVIVFSSTADVVIDFPNDPLNFLWKINSFYYWFTVILTETTKILFLLFCILLSFNFECLMTDVETSIASFSSFTEKIMLNHHYNYYTNIHWINEVNKLFDSLLGVWIACDIVSVVVSLHFVIQNTISLSLTTVYSLRTIWLLLLMYKYAALVKEKAQLTAIAITKLTDSQVNNYNPQVFNLTGQRNVNNWNCNLLIHDLSLSSVGINVSGYFIMTKGSILTLVGTLITYAIVMFQTK